jgi:hypothetical protein
MVSVKDEYADTSDLLEDVTPQRTSLVFVYNADSGLFNALKDLVHKNVSPSTYECNLCAITFGNFGMRREWAYFVSGLDMPVEFLHMDEFIDRYRLEGQRFPAVYLGRGQELEPFITARELNSVSSLEELMDLVTGRLETLGERDGA